MHSDIPFETSLHWRDQFFVPSEPPIGEESDVFAVTPFPLSHDEDLAAAALCLSHDDMNGARSMLKPAAMSGNDIAIMALAGLQVQHQDNWFKRAIRKGSEIAMQELGMTNYGQRHWLDKHVELTGSVISMRGRGDDLASEAVRQGDVITFGWTLYDGVESEDAGKPCLLPSAVVKENTEAPAFQAAVAVSRMIESMRDGDNPKKFLQQNGSVGTDVDAKCDRAEVRRFPTFPKFGRTRFMLEVFRSASADFSERNLMECAKLLDRLGDGFANVVMSSKLFKERVRCGTPQHQTSCGFIAFLVGMKNFAMSLWRKSAGRGCLTGTLMLGLGLFHGWGGTVDRESAGIFLGKCMIDPIALAHVGVASGTRDPLTRATAILGINRTDFHALFEWVGDLFADGTKVPQDPAIADIWWTRALMSLEQQEKPLWPMIDKVSKFCK